jgi:hypothetical protein
VYYRNNQSFFYAKFSRADSKSETSVKNGCINVFYMSIQLTLFDETTELGVDLVNVANTAASRDKWEKQKCRDFGYEQCLNAIFSGKYGIPLIKAYRK